MAGDKFKRVNAGDGLQIPANTWNALLETAEHRERNAFNQSIPRGAVRQVESGLLVRVKNDSGADVDQYCPLMLNGTSVFSPTGDNQEPYSFRKTPILIGVEPVDDPEKAFVITQEPIADGEFGLCKIAGLVSCDIDVTHEDHTHATLKDGDLTQLSSAMFGHKIYFKPSGTGTKTCYVGLGMMAGPMWTGIAQETITPAASGNFKFSGGNIGSLTAIGNSFSGVYAAGPTAGNLFLGDELVVTRIVGQWVISPVVCPE